MVSFHPDLNSCGMISRESERMRYHSAQILVDTTTSCATPVLSGNLHSRKASDVEEQEEQKRQKRGHEDAEQNAEHLVGKQLADGQPEVGTGAMLSTNSKKW